MPTKLHLSGVDELLDELARLTPELTDDAVTLQQRTTAETAAELRGAYAVVTGQLRGSVQVKREGSASPARVFSRIEVTAPYAHFYEFGTVNTEPHPTFVPITRRGREAFTAAVVERVKAAGLVVGGDLR
jgi:Bacteriophage HK97-gp10, putative tail-component